MRENPANIFFLRKFAERYDSVENLSWNFMLEAITKETSCFCFIKTKDNRADVERFSVDLKEH